jgi:hypothetical protein
MSLGDIGISTINGGAIGVKNAIINGNFAVNQRGVSGTVTLAAGAYGHDRFKAGASGCTYTFATSNNITTLTISSGSLIQVIEGLNLYSGTYTLSWTGTAQGKIGAGSFSGSGVTGAAVGGTNLNIEFNTGTLSLVQFEQGSVATPFERRPFGTELALCQRYYYRNAAPSGSHYGSGFNDSSSNAFITVPFPTTMRAAPSALEQSGTAGHYAIQRSGDFPTCTSVPTFSSANTQVAMVQFVSSSNLTAGQGSIGRSANSSGFLAWSAEL